MKIESFSARGYRSLRALDLTGLGPFNVFYGPNGGGKSNILAAMQAWLQLVPIALDTTFTRPMEAMRLPPQQALERWRGYRALHEEGSPLRPYDFALGSKQPKITLEGTL